MSDDPLAEFAAGLRRLRADAGEPSFKTLARRTSYPASTLSSATAGRSVPSLSVVRAFVRACGADANEWTLRWRELIAHRTGAAPAEHGGAPVVHAPEPDVEVGVEAVPTLDGVPIPVLPAGVPAPIPVVPATHPAPGEPATRLPGASQAITADTAVDLPAPATARPARAEVELYRGGPPQRPTGPRHRAPRPPRRRRGKVVTLAVTGVAVGGVVVALSSQHSGPDHTARTSADSSTASPPPARPLIGPGCGTKPESSAFPATAADGWTDVGGGVAPCGGHSLSTQATADPGTVQDTYTWSFQTEKASRCTAWVFVSSTDPSLGVAHYEVSGAEQPLASFTIDQSRFRGRWVSAGPFTTFDGKLQIKLTDRPEAAGARHNVNASAATVGCFS